MLLFCQHEVVSIHMKAGGILSMFRTTWRMFGRRISSSLLHQGEIISTKKENNIFPACHVR